LFDIRTCHCSIYEHVTLFPVKENGMLHHVKRDIFANNTGTRVEGTVLHSLPLPHFCSLGGIFEEGGKNRRLGRMGIDRLVMGF